MGNPKLGRSSRFSRIAKRPEAPSDRISHLTLTTGDLSLGSASGLPAHIMRSALDLVAAGSGPILDTPSWYAEIVYPRNLLGVTHPGAAFFQISSEPDMSVPAVVMGLVCWLPDASEFTWDGVRIAYHINKASYLECGLWRDPPESPPPAPWVATWLTPQFLPVGMLGAELVRAELAIAGALIIQGCRQDPTRE
ncbi:MAG: hypothetical protein PHZ23_15205 [Acidiphilium sp.]|nr:hypothetical protein [Acidiphilium sp.]